MGLNFVRRLTQIRDLLNISINRRDADNDIHVAAFLETHLYSNPKYAQSKRLNRHEYKVFSQYGEDGIINEIFSRIGTTNKYFIEFGVESGMECNSTNLLYKGWQGLWIEGSKNHCDLIKLRFSDLITKGTLTVKNEFITAENIESIFKSANAPAQLDLLSIDIDYNDYYVWQNITNYNPRVVVLEYNAMFTPDTYFKVEYNAGRTWDGSTHFGASLLTYTQLAEQKGYSLVGCSFAGTNAFYVRNDLLGDKFEAPFTTENHYEPQRYFLSFKSGHPRNRRPEI